MPPRPWQSRASHGDWAAQARGKNFQARCIFCRLTLSLLLCSFQNRIFRCVAQYGLHSAHALISLFPCGFSICVLHNAACRHLGENYHAIVPRCAFPKLFGYFSLLELRPHGRGTEFAPYTEHTLLACPPGSAREQREKVAFICRADLLPSSLQGGRSVPNDPLSLFCEVIFCRLPRLRPVEFSRGGKHSVFS